MSEKNEKHDSKSGELKLSSDTVELENEYSLLVEKLLEKRNEI